MHSDFNAAYAANAAATAAYTAYAASSAASYAAAATLRISVTCAIEAIEYARETM